MRLIDGLVVIEIFSYRRYHVNTVKQHFSNKLSHFVLVSAYTQFVAHKVNMHLSCFSHTSSLKT